MSTSGSACRTRNAWALLAACLAFLPAAHAQVARNESQVALQRDLLDPEYSQARAQVTWIDKNGDLWVANVNRSTGLFEPVDGKGTLVDSHAMTSTDFKFITNGPEWVGTAYGDQIVYTKFAAGMAHTSTNARLGLGRVSSKGTWSLHALSPDLPRSTPYATLKGGDPNPIITYVDPHGQHYWRNLYDASTETLVAQATPSRLLSMRPAQGVRAVAFTADADGVQQVFIDWLDTGEIQQITFDDGQKDLHSRPFIWQAPEYHGDLILQTVADDTELRIYHLPARGSNTGWELVDTISTPGNGFINSPEPFEYNGKSYVFFVANVPPANYTSAVFLTGIGPKGLPVRQLTPNQPARVRSDPEVFIANDGPYIYYNRGTYAPNKPWYCLSCNEGIFRTHTGLAPAQ